MTIEWWRDLSVIIFGFTSTAVLLFVAVLALLTYQRVAKILDPVHRTAKIVADVAEAIKEQVAAIGPFFILISKGCEVLRGIFRKDKEETK